MDKSGGLLARACEGILELDLPACIKDGELRYVAVNAAYARFMGRRISDFPGFGTLELSGDPDDAEREDKERRTLVFATEEVAGCRGKGQLGRHAIRCERFIGDDGSMFLFGVFENVPSFELEASESNGADILLGSGVLDLVDVGISIYDRNNRLIYNNARLADFYHPLGLDWRPGLSLETIFDSIYEYGVKNQLPSFDDNVRNKRVWTANRMAKYNLPYFEEVEQLFDGRWLRVVNKRLENGVLVGLRIDVTEFKSHELLLGKHIHETWLFREALEQLPVSVFIRDTDRRLVFANAAYEELLGGNRRKYIGMTETEMFPNASERFRKENDGVLATGVPVQKAEIIPFRDGSTLPAITRIGRIITPDDEHYLVGSITDVSVLQERENQLIAEQNRSAELHKELEAVLKSLPVGVLLLNEDLVIEFANPCFYDIWEAGKNIDLVGYTYRDFMEINYNSGFYDYYGRSFDDAYERMVDRIHNCDVDGSIEMRSSSGKVTIVSKTKIAGGKVLSTYADVTDVRQRDLEISAARAEVERVGEYMQDATSAMAQGLLLIENGIIIMANDAIARMLDLPAELLTTGQTWHNCCGVCARRGDFGDREQADATMVEWNANMDAGRPFSWLFLSGGTRWLSLEATISARNYWLIVLTDVTEMKQREEELKRLLSRSEAADRAKSEFLANMSHEIRTPMNGVLGMAELLAKSDLDTRQKTFTDIIVKSGNALLTIINDILDFSKIDAGQMKLRAAPFDPVEAIEDVASLLSSPAAEKDIELIVRASPSVSHLLVGDAGRFRQIVTNLVGNAVKFTESGHVLIELCAEEADVSEVMLRLRVEDSGIGIPPDKLDSIFDKFSQVDTSSTRRHEGTGLGLAITVGLVGLFGGSITVDSEVGNGSVFTVTLPFHVSAQRNDKPVAPISTKGARVLVIDDNAVNRRILSEQLTMWGVDGYAADSGAAGLAILNEAASIGFGIDAIILDYHMPGMNGIEVAGRIRTDSRFDDIAIIFLTSMDMVGDDSLFSGLNVQAHLMKPARAKLLRSTLGDVIREARLKKRLATDVVPQAPERLREPLPTRPSVKTESAKPRTSDLTLRNSVATGPVSTSQAHLLDVLVAEDNDVNQIVFTQILQATGLNFAIVNNGKQALKAWQEKNPAIILMDISMPIMNGHQATQAIREEEQNAGDGRHVPIIGVTAHALETDRDLCFAAGMDDYLSKPISPELLEAKVSQWLGRQLPKRDTSSGSAY